MDYRQKLQVLQSDAQGTLYDKEDIEIVLDHLHPDGPERSKLPLGDYLHAYLFCDGFGNLMRNSQWFKAFQQAKSYGRVKSELLQVLPFDFAHVRDSSPIGFKMAANYIREVTGKLDSVE